MNGYESHNSNVAGNGPMNYAHASAAQPPSTRAGIEAAGVELYQAVEHVSKRLSELESRLSTILRPEPPSGNGVGGSPTPELPRSGLLHAMLGTKQAVNTLALRLDQLMGRIEL